MARAILTVVQSVSLVLGLAVAANATPSLIQNGDFETGDFSGWTQSGNAWVTAVPYFGLGSNGANGGYMVVFNAGDTAPNAVFSQSFATTPGTVYAVGFDYGGTPGQSVTVQAADDSNNVLASDMVMSPGGAALTSFGFSFMADSTTSSITIADYPGNNTYSSDGALDNVTVTDAPEPASIAVLSAGALAAFGAKRRKAKA